MGLLINVKTSYMIVKIAINYTKLLWNIALSFHKNTCTNIYTSSYHHINICLVYRICSVGLIWKVAVDDAKQMSIIFYDHKILQQK